MLIIDPPPLATKPRYAFLAAVKHSAKVGLERHFPIFESQVGHRAKNTDARIVYQDVQRRHTFESMKLKKFETSAGIAHPRRFPQRLLQLRSLIALRSASTSACDRPQIATDAPSRASDSAIARPMPFVLPVTAAILPSRNPAMQPRYSTHMFHC